MSKFSLQIQSSASPVTIAATRRCLPVAMACSFVASDNPGAPNTGPDTVCVIEQITVRELAMLVALPSHRGFPASWLASHRDLIKAAIGLRAEITGLDNLLGVVDDLEGLVSSFRPDQHQAHAMEFRTIMESIASPASMRSSPAQLAWPVVNQHDPLAVYTNAGPAVLSLLARSL